MKRLDIFLAVFCGACGILCLLPVLLMLGGLLQQNGHPTLAHVAAAFSDPARSLLLLANSGIVVVGTLALSLGLGAPLGFLCFRTDLPFRGPIILGCLLAACIPLHATTTAWMALAGMPFWQHNAWGASWIGGIAYTPLVALIAGVGFASGNRALEEEASLDAPPGAVMRHVTLPLGAWSVVAAALTVTAFTLWDITVTDIVMLRTFAEEVFTQFQLGANPCQATAIALPIMVLFAASWLAIGRFARHHGRALLSDTTPPPALFALGRARVPVALLVGLLFSALFLVPLLALFKAVGTFDNLATAWRTASNEFLFTLRVIPLAATLCVGLAIPAVWAFDRIRRLRRWLAAGWILLLSTPAPIVGIGLIFLLNRPGLAGLAYDSEAGLILAYIIRTLPFAMLALLPAIRRIPRELEEAAALDGASGTRLLGSIVIPLSRPSILLAWLLVFILALSDMGASFLVSPPGQTTLTTRFFTLIHYGVYPDAAGLCLILLGLIGVIAGVMAGLVWPPLRRRFQLQRVREVAL